VTDVGAGDNLRVKARRVGFSTLQGIFEIRVIP
jgi:hypothetical protein